MNWKKITFYAIAVLGSIIIIFFGFLAYVAFIPPDKYQPENRSIANQSKYALDEKVGWYRFEDGSEWLITWRPHGGLLTLNFVDFANYNLLPKTKNKFNWFRDGKTIEITFQDSAKIVTGFSWIDSSGVAHTAQRMKNPPYKQKELDYNNGNVSLVGTLLIPNARDIQSVATIIHGSGVSHRDNFWYLYQADYFAKKGIIILLPDKRGSGASGGAWHTASMQNLANDVIAGAQKIQELNFTDSLNSGFIGFSQGGAIAPLAAKSFSDTDFIVNVVGSAVSYNEQLKFEVYNDVRMSGVPAFIAPLVTSAYTRQVKARRPVWWEKNGDYNPTSYFGQLKIPSLIVYGGKDLNAPVEQSLKNLRELKNTPNGNNIAIKVYENSGHAMGDPDTGWIRKEYLNFVSEWIVNLNK
ncbi:MAG: prolyl oligopeptidase family serine peptidase [Caldithrix sp.]|nr:prolyl oligopeptidase family serine peptidase [Caldithrix sp.]